MKLLSNILPKERFTLMAGLLIFACIVLIGFTSESGYISYFYTLFCFLVLNLFTEKKHQIENIKYFHFFVFLAICLFLFQRSQFPAYMGLSGPEYIGTDDVRYFYGLNVKTTYSIERTDIAFSNTFTPLIDFLYLPPIKNSIDIVIFNILGISFLPYLTYRTAMLFLQDKIVALQAERLILFCPFIMSVGLIIMRDVVSTSLILSSFICFAKKKYVFFLLLASVLIYLKFGFVVFLCIILVAYLLMQERLGSKNKNLSILKFVIFIVGFIVVFILYILPNLSILTQGRLSSESLFRDSFLEYLSDKNEQSFLVKIYSLPVVFRIPVLILTFLFIPFLTPNFIHGTNFLMGAFLQVFIAPIYWCFLYLHLFNFFFLFGKLKTRGKTILYLLLTLALILGMISLQSRHKVILMPFIYIAIAYAMRHVKFRYSLSSVLCLLVFIFAQIFYFFIHM